MKHTSSPVRDEAETASTIHSHVMQNHSVLKRRPHPTWLSGTKVLQIVLLSTCVSTVTLAQIPNSAPASAPSLGVIPETGQVIPAPQIDLNAPGLSYTPERMAERIMEMAEGPIPSREDLEKEFGFKFWKLYAPAWEKFGDAIYYGTAATPPFEINRYPQYQNITYSTSRESIDINFKFNSDFSTQHKQTTNYCVQPEFFIKKLTQWKYNNISRHHTSDNTFYTLNRHGIYRNMSFSPSNLETKPCVRLAGITYSIINNAEK